MPEYQLYFLSKENHVRRRVDLPDCCDDAHAIEVVADHIKEAPFTMELWQRARLVKRFERSQKG